MKSVRLPSFKDKARVHGAAARPADVAGPECSPAPVTDTDLRCSSMVQDASRPCSPPCLLLVCCLGLPAGGRICNQRTIDSCDPTLVCFSGAWSELFRVNFSQGVRSIAGTTVLQAAAVQQLRLSVRSNF